MDELSEHLESGVLLYLDTPEQSFSGCGTPGIKRFYHSGVFSSDTSSCAGCSSLEPRCQVLALTMTRHDQCNTRNKVNNVRSCRILAALLNGSAAVVADHLAPLSYGD